MISQQFASFVFKDYFFYKSVDVLQVISYITEQILQVFIP